MRRRRHTLVFFLVSQVLVLCVLFVGVEAFFYLRYRFLRTDWVMWYEKTLPTAAPDADFTIVCVGDSHTEGGGAPPGSDYPLALSKLLKRDVPGVRFDVVNLGVSATNSSQDVNMFTEFLNSTARKPDMAILCTGHNNEWNLLEASFLPDDVQEGPDRQLYAYLKRHSQAYRLSRFTVARLRPLVSWRKWDPEELFQIDDPAEVTLLAEWLRLDLDRFYTLCAAFGIQPVLLSYWHDIPRVNATFSEYGRKMGVPFIDVRNFRIDSPPFPCPSEWTVSDCHPNARGYSRVADLVEEGLRQYDLPPLGP